MNTLTTKTQDRESQSVTNDMSQKQRGSESTLQLADKRPAVITQRKLHEMAKNSSQTMQLSSLQDMTNNSPHAEKTFQLQTMTKNDSSQQHPPIQRQQNRTGLPNNLKAGIENISGYSMDDVKVHYNSDKPAQLNAHAYAQGTDIHVASGQEKHLPHEAWHVVQQKQGRVKPTLQLKGTAINDDVHLENEADIMGQQANAFSDSSQVGPTIHGSGVTGEGSVQRLCKECATGDEELETKDVAQKKADVSHSGIQLNSGLEQFSSVTPIQRQIRASNTKGGSTIITVEEAVKRVMRASETRTRPIALDRQKVVTLAEKYRKTAQITLPELIAEAYTTCRVEEEAAPEPVIFDASNEPELSILEPANDKTDDVEASKDESEESAKPKNSESTDFAELIKNAKEGEVKEKVKEIKDTHEKAKPIDAWPFLAVESIFHLAGSIAKIGIAIASGFAGIVNVVVGKTIGSIASLIVGIVKGVRAFVTRKVEKMRGQMVQNAVTVSAAENLSEVNPAVVDQNKLKEDTANKKVTINRLRVLEGISGFFGAIGNCLAGTFTACFGLFPSTIKLIRSVQQLRGQLTNKKWIGLIIGLEAILSIVGGLLSGFKAVKSAADVVAKGAGFGLGATKTGRGIATGVTGMREASNEAANSEATNSAEANVEEANIAEPPSKKELKKRRKELAKEMKPLGGQVKGTATKAKAYANADV